MTDWIKAAFAVLVLVLATAMLWTKALTGAEWVSVASADLWAFLLAHVAAIGVNGAVSYMVANAEAKAATAKAAAGARA